MAKFQPIRYQDFSGGQNDKVVGHLILDSEVRLAQNCILDDPIGALTKRLGYTQIGNQITASTAVFGNYYFNSSNSARVQHLVACNVSGSAGIFYNDSGTWTTTLGDLTAGEKIRFESFLDYVFAFNGSNAPKSWTGVGGWGSTNLTGAPICKYGRVFQDKLFFANATANQSRLYFSRDVDSGSISFSSDGYRDINPEDGQTITGLDENSGRLLIFKDNSMFRMNVSGITKTSEPDPIIDIGTSSQESVKTINGITYFFNRYGVYVYDGSMPYLISRKIQDWIDGITQSDLDKVTAEVDGDHYYLAVGNVTIGTDTYTNVVLVYTIPLKAWTIWTMGDKPTFFGHYYSSGARYISFGDSNGEVFRLNNGNSDDNAAIPVNIETKAYDLQTPEEDKKFTETFLITDKAKGLVEVGAKIDDEAIKTIGYVEDDVTRLPADLVGKKLAITLSESGVGEQWSFQQLIFRDTFLSGITYK